jgi:hypothetical protein
MSSRRERADDLRGRATAAIFRRHGKLFCSAISSPSPFYEGQPSCFRRMAAGRPGSNVYGIREAVVDGETGMLVPPGSAVERLGARRAHR